MVEFIIYKVKFEDIVFEHAMTSIYICIFLVASTDYCQIHTSNFKVTDFIDLLSMLIPTIYF